MGIHSVCVADGAAVTVKPGYGIDNSEGDGRTFYVTALTLPVSVARYDAQKRGMAYSPSSLTLIPYYAWNHRGACPMLVWFKKKI